MDLEGLIEKETQRGTKYFTNLNGDIELIEYLADINDMTTAEYEEYVRWCHDNPRSIDEIETELAQA